MGAQMFEYERTDKEGDGKLFVHCFRWGSRFQVPGSKFQVSSLLSLTLLRLGIASELALLSLCATVKVRGVKIFFLVLIVRGLGVVCDVLAKNILPVLEIVVYLQRERVSVRV